MELTLLTAKDISHHTGVSLSTAKQLSKDIRTEYGLKTKPTLYHLKVYLGVKRPKEAEKVRY